MKIFLIFLLIIILLPFILRIFVSLFFRVPEGYKLQKKKEGEEKAKQLLEKQGNKIEEKFISQFSPETLIEEEKFMSAFTLNTKPFSEIPDDTKIKIILENTKSIEGLSEEDRLFFAKTLYDIIVEGNPARSLIDFLFEKLNLKFKKNAEQIVRNQMHKAYCKFHRLELLHCEVKKAKWIFLGNCSIEKHKFLNGIIFNLETGFYDDELNKYIFPADLENCDCDFVAVNDFDEYEDK
jgi:hypothetical protein